MVRPDGSVLSFNKALAEKTPRMKIRILTYNIHGAKGVDRCCDFQRIGSFLKDQNIDIALLQEFDTRSQQRSTDKDINDIKSSHFAFFEPAPTIKGLHGWYGNAIFSRFPISKSSVIDISAPGREPRNILEAFVETPSGPLRVVNTHKGLKSSERSVQFAVLHRLLSVKSEVPLIVGGDLNEWTLLSSPLRKINEVLRPISPGATFPTFYPILHLDRMWCKPAHLVTKARVLKTKETRVYSDHYPILAEIDF